MVATVSNWTDALARVVEDRPDIAVLGCVLPGSGTLHLVRELAASHPECPCVIFCRHGDGCLLKSITAGARGVLHKDAGVSKIVVVIRAVHARKVV